MINYEHITKQLPGGLADFLLNLIADVQMRPSKYRDVSRNDIMNWLSQEHKGKGMPKP